MSTPLNYVVCLIILDHRHFLLWQDGGNEPDKYILVPETAFFLSAQTVEDLLRRATRLGLQVTDQDPVLVNIDKVFRVLAELRPGRASSQRTCQLLLDGWNTLEDMARSIQISLDEQQDDYEREVLRNVYDKLFYGNNLPAVTPSNRNYSPLLSSNERKVMRRYFRRLWLAIENKSGFTEPGTEPGTDHD